MLHVTRHTSHITHHASPTTGKPQYGGSDCNTVYHTLPPLHLISLPKTRCFMVHIRYCTNNCSNTNPQGKFDRGECLVKRTPSLEDPLQEDIEATCVCGDTFSGDDCGQEAWQSVLDAKLLDLQSDAWLLRPAAAAAAAAAAAVVVMLMC